MLLSNMQNPVSYGYKIFSDLLPFVPSVPLISQLNYFYRVSFLLSFLHLFPILYCNILISTTYIDPVSLDIRFVSLIKLGDFHLT